MDINLIISKELNLKNSQVEKTVALLDEGNTIPFIARYRKEVTSNMNEEVLRDLDERLRYLRNLEDRKKLIITSIEEQGKLTPELKEKILNTWKLNKLEDLYLPFRPKRKTRASAAREKGLLPLAELIMKGITKSNIEAEAEKFIDPEKKLDTIEDVIGGAKDIVAEKISEDLKVRDLIRKSIEKEGKITSLATDKEKVSNYEIYYDYEEKFFSMPPHRILAINRGEKEKYLKVSIEIDVERAFERIKNILHFPGSGEGYKYYYEALEDGFKRLLWPSIEREMRKSKTAEAEKKAIEIFSRNLKSLILQNPLKGHKILGIDPGFRTGCKIAAIDEKGDLITTATIYPHPPQKKEKEAARIISEILKTSDIKLIAVGNGTACRETESFLVNYMSDFPENVAFTIVNEAGASVYSASPLAKKEFPTMDVSMRGAVSIARRLQDPMSELVKIEPKSIGVGMYQHDVNQKELSRVLTDSVESVVNLVGVDLNTASPSLLEYVSGLSSKHAKSIVLHRQKNGAFKNRKELLKVSGLGEKTFVLCSGFLRIFDGDNPLDMTPVHPESYWVIDPLFARLGFNIKDLTVKARWSNIKKSMEKFSPSSLSSELGIGELTLKDIMEALQKPGRDPREDIPPPVFKRDVLTMEQLKEGMELKGTVRNVVDFGAFVDIGVKRDGLIHISQMGDRFVKNPNAILSPGQNVSVEVISVDKLRNRISLKLIGR